MCTSNFNEGTSKKADTCRLIRRSNYDTKTIGRETNYEEGKWK